MTKGALRRVQVEALFVDVKTRHCRDPEMAHRQRLRVPGIPQDLAALGRMHLNILPRHRSEGTAVIQAARRVPLGERAARLVVHEGDGLLGLCRRPRGLDQVHMKATYQACRPTHLGTTLRLPDGVGRAGPGHAPRHPAPGGSSGQAPLGSSYPSAERKSGHNSRHGSRTQRVAINTDTNGRPALPKSTLCAT